jgi:hypothetical protein
LLVDHLPLGIRRFDHLVRVHESSRYLNSVHCLLAKASAGAR